MLNISPTTPCFLVTPLEESNPEIYPLLVLGEKGKMKMEKKK
jgi:hypothetical protein